MHSYDFIFSFQGMNNERNENSSSRWMINTMNGPEPHDGRPRSSCEVPRVPGIKYAYIF